MAALQDLTDRFVRDEDPAVWQHSTAPAGATHRATQRTRGVFERWYSDLSSDAKLRATMGFPMGMIFVLGLVGIGGLYSIDPAAGAASIEATRNMVAAITAAAVLFSAAMIGISTFVISRDIIDTVRSLNADMKRIADGETDFAISVQGRTDEYGEMSEAMEYMRLTNVRAKQLADEKEEAVAERELLFETIATGLESTVGEVAGSIASASSQLHSTATGMAATADQGSAASKAAMEAVGRASEGALAAAASSDEFAMSIGEISRQAAHSAELARKATGAANDADLTITGLSDAAEKVGAIVELIQSIAKRTNLLALNASIEAARGGEAGRGFAVVASEVKELASQTSRATEDVAAQIRAMQDSTGASVAALRSVTEHIQQMETTASSIASAVDQQSVAGREMARSIDISARSSEEVANHIGQVHQTASSTGTAASQVLGSSSDLQRQAEDLRIRVAEFLGQIRSA